MRRAAPIASEECMRVLHLIPGAAYLAVPFTLSNIGTGGFSYTSPTPPVPEPSHAWMILAVATVTLGGRSCQRLG